MQRFKKTWKLYWKLLMRIAPFKKEMGYAIISGIVGFLLAFSLLVFGGYALLQVLQTELPRGSMDGLPFARLPYQTLFLLMGLAAFFRAFLHYLEQLFNHEIAFKVLAHLRDLLFKAMRRLCPAKLERQARGQLIALISGDIELLEVFYAHTISPMAIASGVYMLLLGYFALLDPLLLLYASLAYPLLAIVLPLWNSKRSREGAMAQRHALGQLNEQFLDSLEGVREIVQYQQEARFLDELTAIQGEIARQQRKLAKEAARHEAFIDSLVLALILGMGALATYRAELGLMRPAAALLGTLCFFTSVGPFVALARLGTGLSHTTACGHRVMALLEEKAEVAQVVEGERPEFDALKVQDLHFAYEEESVLKGLHLTLKPGERLGIQGVSGCGKSTLLKLILRFWDPQSGEIRLGASPLKQVETAWLRQQTCLLSQDTALFTGSLAENLRIAKPDASDEALEAALQAASLAAYVHSLPQGLETQVHELGENFSGGERQRLALARAFLAQAPLLLLDEPTSQLDSLNEAVILNALEKHPAKALLMVSHRASTLGICDRIEKMHAGRFVARQERTS